MEERGQMYRVILADDEDFFRHWLRSLLERDKDFQVVGEAANGREAIGLIARLAPDLVIADLDMPEGDGLDVARHIRVHAPGIKVVLITGHAAHGYARLAQEEGVLAFILKADLTREALHQALGGEG